MFQTRFRALAACLVPALAASLGAMPALAQTGTPDARTPAEQAEDARRAAEERDFAPLYGPQQRAPADFGRGTFSFIQPLLSVFNRPREEFTPTGFRAYGFVFLPQMLFEVAYDDNVFAADTDTQEDFRFVWRPAYRVQSEWANHLFGFEGNVEIEKYADETGENTEQGAFTVFGRYDLSRRDALYGSAGYERVALGRGDPETVIVLERPEQDIYRGQAGYTRDFAQFVLRVQGDYRRIDYRNTADQVLDRNEYGGTVQVRYAWTPRINPFVEVGIAEQEYDVGVRDRMTYGALVGARLDFTGLVQGEAAIGVGRSEFDNAALEDFTTLTARANIVWNPTELVSVLVGASRDTEATGNVGASSRVVTRLNLRGEYELRRNLLVFAEGVYRNEEFEGLNRDDDVYNLATGGELLINENLSVFGRVGYEERSSSAVGLDFDRSFIVLGARAQF